MTDTPVTKLDSQNYRKGNPMSDERKLDSVERLLEKYQSQVFSLTVVTIPGCRAALTEMWDLSRREALREAAGLARSLFDTHLGDGCECSGLEDLAEDLERLAVEEGTK